MKINPNQFFEATLPVIEACKSRGFNYSINATMYSFADAYTIRIYAGKGDDDLFYKAFYSYSDLELSQVVSEVMSAIRSYTSADEFLSVLRDQIDKQITEHESVIRELKERRNALR